MSVTLTADSKPPPTVSVTASELSPPSDISFIAVRTVSDERQDTTSREPIPSAGNGFSNVEVIEGWVEAYECANGSAREDVLRRTYFCHEPSKETYVGHNIGRTVDFVDKY
jgi:hypothetical protein